MPYRVSVHVTGFDGVTEYLTRVRQKLTSPYDGLLRATQNVGKYWEKNFQTEGAYVGGWAALAERTVEERVRQGFPGEHPIMLRYGSLFRISSTMFANAAGPDSQTETSPYDPRGNRITGQLTLNDKTAELSVEGPQVFNQFPGIRTPRPARPFWFINDGITIEARRGVEEWLIDEVLQ